MITSPKPTGKELWKAFVDAIWALLMPVIILGGIYGGYFTPTEAAAVAVVYGLIIGLFVYRELKWKDIPKTFAILGMYISPNQSSLAIAIATGVSNLGGFASAYYLNMLGIITGEKLFTPIYVLMGVYTLLATAFMVYDPLLKNS